MTKPPRELKAPHPRYQILQERAWRVALLRMLYRHAWLLAFEDQAAYKAAIDRAIETLGFEPESSRISTATIQIEQNFWKRMLPQQDES